MSNNNEQAVNEQEIDVCEIIAYRAKEAIDNLLSQLKVAGISDENIKNAVISTALNDVEKEIKKEKEKTEKLEKVIELYELYEIRKPVLSSYFDHLKQISSDIADLFSNLENKKTTKKTTINEPSSIWCPAPSSKAHQIASLIVAGNDIEAKAISASRYSKIKKRIEIRGVQL